MHKRPLKSFVLSSLTFAVAAVVACGSADKSKKTSNDEQNDASVGAPRDGGTTPPGGGRDGGTGGMTSGDAGDVQGGSRGMVGDASTSGTAGAGDAGVSDAGNVTPPFRGLYIGPAGDDAADGSLEAPFATLAHAASLAVAGDTIVFLDGDYTLPAGVVAIPGGVNLAAQNAGAVVLKGTGPLLDLQGDSRITGLDIENFATPVRFVGADKASGTVTIENTRFDNCVQSCLTLSGAAKAVVIGDAGAELANGGGAFAILTETSSLSITGGVLQNFQAGGIIRADDASTVSLADIKVENGTGAVLVLRNDATGVVERATVAVLSAAMFQLYNASELTVKDSDVSAKPAAPKGNCFLAEGTNKLTIEGSKVHGCGTGIKRLPDDLRVTGSEFYDLEFGAEATTGTSSVEGNVVIDGCHFRDISYSALRLGMGGVKLNVKVRDTVVDVSTLANWGAVILDGTNTSRIDLGTLGEPGGNKFLQGNTTSQHTALQIGLAAVTVYAVGNTWTPNVQGADMDGHFAVVSGKVLDETSTVAGRNFSKPQPTTTLRLAEKP